MADEPSGQKKTTKDKEPSTLEDLGASLSGLIPICLSELMACQL